MPAESFESVSTWHQPLPEPASAARTELVRRVAGSVAARSPARLRVAIDGITAAGKTSFGHELAAMLRQAGRPTLRASLDDFKYPWRHAAEHGYDRLTGEGYYRNAPDFDSARDLLLGPAGPDGSGQVVLCAFDPLTGEDRRGTVVTAPPDAILVVDGVFMLRPEYDAYWDYRIWLEVDRRLALARGVSRDAAVEGEEAARRVHRDRYHAAEEIYVREVDPQGRADVIIDNSDFARPRILEMRS